MKIAPNVSIETINVVKLASELKSSAGELLGKDFILAKHYGKSMDEVEAHRVVGLLNEIEEFVKEHRERHSNGDAVTDRGRRQRHSNSQEI